MLNIAPLLGPKDHRLSMKVYFRMIKLYLLFLTKLCVLKIERHFFPLTFLSFVGGVEWVYVFFCVLQCITTGCRLYLLQEFRIDVSKNKLPITNRNTKCNLSAIIQISLLYYM